MHRFLVLRSICLSSSLLHFKMVPSILRWGQPRYLSLLLCSCNIVLFQIDFSFSWGTFNFFSFISTSLMASAFNIPKYLYVSFSPSVLIFLDLIVPFLPPYVVSCLNFQTKIRVYHLSLSFSSLVFVSVVLSVSRRISTKGPSLSIRNSFSMFFLSIQLFCYDLSHILLNIFLPSLHPVADVSSPILSLLGRIFFRCFGMACFSVLFVIVWGSF